MAHSLSSIGRRIRSERKDRGWTLNYLSTRSGISVSHISEIERGTSDFTVTNLLRLSEAFDMTPERLLIGGIRQTAAFDEVLSSVTEDCSLFEMQLLTDMLISVKGSLRSFTPNPTLELVTGSAAAR